MNTKRLYIGNLYYNDGLESNDTYKIDLVQEDVLLIKFGNKYINANLIKTKFDLISFYTFLKYYSLNNSYPISDYVYKTDNNRKGIFVDKKSLKKYRKNDEKIDFDRFKKICIMHEYVKDDKKLKKINETNNIVL